MKKSVYLLVLILMGQLAWAQKDGGIDAQLLEELRAGYKASSSDKAVRNALNTTSINTLALNAENSVLLDTHFSDRVQTKGITDQKSSGRCWLFTGLNVLRAEAISRNILVGLELMQDEMKRLKRH